MYLKKAGTVLVAVSILIWASMTFPTLDPEQAAPLETQRSPPCREKVDALPEGDEARALRWRKELVRRTGDPR